MKITTKLYLVLLLPLILLVLVGGVLLRSNQIITTEAQREALVEDVTRGTFELNILTYEHLQRQTGRTKQQWQQKHATLTRILKSVDFSTPSDQVALAQARWTLEELKNIFADLINTQEAASPANPAVTKELKERLVGQLLAESQSLMSLTATLSRSCDQTRVRIRRHSYWLTILFVTGTAVGVGVTVLLVSRGITQPIRNLRHGAEQLASGRLDHKIGSVADDELGEVSRAFDSMAGSLQQREEELRRHRDHLEELVRERTEKLEQANEQLQKMTAALRESNAELQQFASVASHDLQEPLRMISSYVQMLERRYKGKLDADADQFIWFAVDGAKRMHQLINDLLQYARVETRGKPPTPVSCRVAVDNALQNLQIAIQDARAEMVVAPEWPTVLGDDVQLTQLFQNLIANALKFRQKEAPLRVEVGAERIGEEWVFHVSDNGIGIDPKFYERIFVIFQRLHSREEYPGTGIGLALCKRIVQRHGGRIWVESKPGHGSTFYFTLPGK